MNNGELSRVISHALRHEPWLYELELDDEGWVPIEELLSALRTEKPEWSFVIEADLAEMIARSDKKRHELQDGKIRALYGHSIPDKLSKQPAEPPVILYHGTSPETAQRIKVDGLRPMGRQYVHLSVDIATAEQVARRKTQMPVLLLVKATQAYTAGIAFYRGNDQVWLADFVPATFIE
jgi:putative RNA 2'-phosphotransferase